MNMSEVDACINPTNPVVLPPELWLRVASFLREDQLWELRTLNRILFCVAMDEKYKSTTISTNRFYFSSTMLNRLKCLPFITDRIEFLGLDFEYTCGYLPEEKILPRVPQYWYRAKRHWVVSYIELLSSFMKLPEYFCRPYPRRHETGIVTSVFPHLPNVRHIYINMACFRRPRAPEVDPDLHYLFTAMGTSLGSQIETLVIRGGLIHCSHLANFDSSLPRLKTLKVEMDYNPFIPGDADPPDNLKTIVRGVAHFIRNQSSHLETLSIKLEASVSVDFSDLFSSAQVFPFLHSLELSFKLRIWRDQAPVLNPRLQAFLKRHSHLLRRLHLFLYSPDPLDLSPWVLPWLTKDELAFTRLEDLRLEEITPSTSMDVALAFIRRASDTLKNICILDRPFQDDDLINMLKALSPCRQLTRLNLTLDLFAINVKVFDLVSAALPHLRDLEIQTLPHQVRDNPIPFLVVDDSPLLQDLKTRTYPDWHLESFTVRNGDYALVLPDEVKATIRRCIPSLQYFPGDNLLDTASFELYPKDTTNVGEFVFFQRHEQLWKARYPPGTPMTWQSYMTHMHDT